MIKSENISQQERLAREFESWQKQYYDDVYSIFEKRDEHRLVIAFNHWEDRFIKFLEDRLPRIVEVYKTQTLQSISLAYHGGSIQNFKPVKSDRVEAFLTQYILEARKGNLDNYVVTSGKKTTTSYDSAEMRSPLIRVLTFAFVIIPKTIGRLLFDIVGQGDKAALSSTVIFGYITIIVTVLLLLGVLSPNTLIDIYHFFKPEPK